tara:strand:+ start:36 stop:1838 length:1803 start_codon:yes stop_codon:yes gene_type:complete
MADLKQVYDEEAARRDAPFGYLPKSNFGRIGSGILGGIEFIGDASEAIRGFPNYLAEGALDYLSAPTEYGESLAAAEVETEKADEQAKLLAAIEADPTLLGEFGGLGQAVNIPQIDMSGLDIENRITGANYQEAAKKKKGEEAEAFRKTEEQLVDAQGGLNSMSITDSTAITQEQTDAGFMAAMDDFFEGARGAGPKMPEERTIEQYKQAFSDATGIDTSGTVDKKDALMAFGLALMQNKAGPNFNVGKMLSEVGVAGDKAMPALQKAKDRARQGALAGGKYALQTQSADKATRAAAQEKMINRDKYWVYEKGKDGSAFGGFDKGQFEDLNKYELDKLLKDPEFSKKYDFINANDRMEILAKRAEGTDLGDAWGDKYESISLIGGKWEEMPPALVVNAVKANPNYGGTTSSQYKLGEDAGEVVKRFVGFQEGINKDQATFEKLIKNIEAGVSVPGQALDKVTGFFRAIGYTPAGGMPSNTAQAKQALDNFAIDNATDILKESGKTLSDGDRKLVSQRVGKIDFFNNDPELILNQVRDIYSFTVTKAQTNLDTAVGKLEKDFGISFSSNQGNNAPSEAELELINQRRVSNGQEPRTMEDYK